MELQVANKLKVPTLYELSGAACRQAAKITLSGASATDSSSCWELAVPYYQEASESGDPEASFELAWLHFAGVGVQQQSVEKALDYWQRVMNQSNNDNDPASIFKTISTYMFGLCHYLGFGGTELDLVKGWRLMNECKGDEFVLSGQWALDWEWEKPIGTIQSSSCASQVFFEHVSFESSINCVLEHLEGVCYFYGFGTSKDQNKAFKIFARLANSGFAASQVFLGSCYLDGYVVRKNPKTSFQWFQRSAEQGYAWGQCALADCYIFGMGVSNDDAKAVKWYQKAADQGHAPAQSVLGSCYYSGRGVPRDYTQAVEWYRKAADQGHAPAQSVLGNCYYSGLGVLKDFTKAVEWYRKAADQGDSEAQRKIAFCYDQGLGVARDHVKAIEWYRKALGQEAYAQLLSEVEE